MKQQLKRLLRYDVWANRETLESLRPSPTPPKSLAWMAHIVGSECLWLARLKNETSPLAVWPELTVDQCAERLSELEKAWEEYVTGITDSKLEATVTYTNSKGERWTSTVEEILTHVTVHSAYHRGQIASDVRASGGVPAYTDYIHAARQRFV
jgi:uncharacterized damage-inducible protein DinB